ncbi:uncharacterized protein L3040_008123 [Drepanopeziza brunnea f. sp. 'multigermtubi']|uniref:Luciferase domain-containing protein n=1 Tax=Marssonina brunnea f. sp. multigermtubi (strain MB_m1) TaxID=1072389 RepID=K1X0Z8_MARBU|nr:uncharacterized protein MBM_03143 [Drepanopeziza brunnea f. sp. 'multigermtubi' MB_m1]EKD18901.1 hypothetical protein MBM_03143 [Drepanopeziza brunnea f. sp. 'multigermtubi' MB_m1]KAJ5034854.1 hypothetical protein L3040_008123 [Drepanopeziza brunnea f. sp. 'multigermtubi']
MTNLSLLDPKVLSFIRSPRAIAIPLVGAFVTASIWSIKDYRAFLALGRGGIPYNFFGWALLTIFVRPFALREEEATRMDEYPREGAHASIEALQPRKGERAVLKGIAPHRQLTQNAPEAMKKLLHEVFDEMVSKHPLLLKKKRSLYERHHDAIFLRPSLLQDANSSGIPDAARISRGEIGHVHEDGSMHLYFSPADTRLVVERGWAERHRLARTRPLLGRWNLFGVTSTYVMVYGPRDEDELAIVRVLLESSVRFMSGREEEL